MLNNTCSFTCKSLGVVVVVSEVKLEVSGEVSKLIKSSKSAPWQQPTGAGLTMMMTITRYNETNLM